MAVAEIEPKDDDASKWIGQSAQFPAQLVCVVRTEHSDVVRDSWPRAVLVEQVILPTEASLAQVHERRRYRDLLQPATQVTTAMLAEHPWELAEHVVYDIFSIRSAPDDVRRH
jgi:hypothetical protein